MTGRIIGALAVASLVAGCGAGAAAVERQRRRCTVPRGNSTAVAPAAGRPLFGSQRSRRNGPDGETCHWTQSQEDLNNKLNPSSGGDSRHTLPMGGGLTIEWAGGPHQEMIIVCGISGDELVQSGYQTNLWFSADDGSTFVNAPVNELIIDALFSTVPFNNPSNPDEVGEYMVYALPSSEGGSDQKRLWASANTGGTWTQLDLSNVPMIGATFRRLVPHPTRADTFLAVDQGQRLHVCQNAARAVSDGGQGLQCAQVASLVFDFAWSENGASEDLAYLTIGNQAENPDKLKFARFTGVRVPINTDDMSYPLGDRPVANFEEQNQYVFLTDVPQGDSFEASLWVSSDRGATFRQAEFPFHGQDNHFVVVDASEDFVLVAVNHNMTRPEGSLVVNIFNGPSHRGDTPARNASAFRALFSELISTEGTDPARLVYDARNPEACLGSTPNLAPEEYQGNYLLVRRGSCKFYLKAQYAEALGAVGVVIVNSVDTHRLYMQAPDGVNLPNISVVIVSSSDGDALIQGAQRGSNPVWVSLQEVDAQETVLYRQSNLYASDELGVEFSLSLKNVLYEAASDSGGSANSYTDVYKVESLNGSYIANFRNSSDGREYTVITYDKGAYWWTLSPPEDYRSYCDLDGAPGACRLRLALESSNALNGYPMPVSTPTAVGVIVANGWIQSGSMTDPFTVISRDAGMTWHQLEHVNSTGGGSMMPPHNFRILDHGAVIVFTPYRSRTLTVAYSLDEGRNGQVFEYSFAESEGQLIQGIVTEPGGTTTRAFAYYYENQQWEGIKLDFTAVLGASCTVESGDFEPAWIARTPMMQSDCVLGATRSYKRREPCHICFNDIGSEALDYRRCPCGNQDFRCSRGLHRPNNVDARGDIECVLDSDANLPSCSHRGKLVKYSLISGDVCRGPEESGFLTPVDMPCDESALLPEVGKALGYLVAAALLGVLLIGFVFTFSKDARVAAIATFGTDGAIGSFLLKFNCFKRTEGAYIYSKLADANQTLFEEDEEDDSANELGLYDDDDEDSNDGGHDDDDMLFSMADDTGSGAGLPIADI